MNAETLAEPTTHAAPRPEVDVEAEYVRERGKPLPGFKHSYCQANLIGQLLPNREFQTLSELNLDLGGWRSVPDLCVFPRHMNDKIEDQIWVTEVPAIAVEIISPSQSLDDMFDKVNKLIAGGVPSVWLVLPAVGVISIFQKNLPFISATQGTLTDPGTGIVINVDEVFA